MIITRSTRNSVLFVAFACVLALGPFSAFAADSTEPLEPSPVAGEPSTSGLTPVPDGGAMPGSSLLGDSQIIPTYQCAPETDCAVRACMVGPSGQYWFRADYLLWRTRGVDLVPLVTTSDVEDQGIIGNDTTRILFGNDRINGDSHSGTSIKFGWWFHCGRTAGVEFDFLTLGERGTDFYYSSSSTGYPLYARPFDDVNPESLGSNAELISETPWLRGTVDGRVDEYFHSAGVNLRLNLCCHEPCCSCGCSEDCGECCEEECGDGSCCSEMECTRAAVYCRGLGSLLERFRPSRYRVDLIAGYRHYQLNDSLRVNESSLVLQNHDLLRAGTTIDLFDEFRSRNEFHGGELGVIAQIYRGCWSFEFLAKMALGNNSQVVTINGQTTIDTHQQGDEPAVYGSGMLAMKNGTEGNIGRYTNDDFVVIPQFGAEIGYQMTCHMRAYVGYNLIYWANVARAAEQVDYTLNSEYFPPANPQPSGAARPAFAWEDSNFWAQGLNLGLEYRF
ncbi:MAG: BBP7 family outer membrane beta-barrel protein [Pirellulales bacterium]|nr:BBP7 family outer membrane beta-barrel protein [Pirellulales bacterium]